jgi:sterol desaturase/sphingolipid hydroxylase (fatty acid hydroxylase superfamily)
MLAMLLGTAVALLVMAGLLAPLENWFPVAPSRPQARAVVACVALFFFNTVLMQLVGAPVLEGLEAQFAIVESPSWARLLAVLVLSDVAGYWMHRAMHRVPVLWRLHSVHHAPTELHWFEAWRQHPLDFLMHGIAVGVPGAVLGASLAEIASVVLIRKVFTAFLHANVRWRFGPLEWVLATPLFHRVHHSADPRDYDRNFAGTFAWVDVLFRTHRPAHEFPRSLGLEPPPVSRHFSLEPRISSGPHGLRRLEEPHP